MFLFFSKNLTYFIFVFLLTVLTVTCDKGFDAEEIVSRSIAAHGGKSRWKSFQKITYLKEIELFDRMGNLEQTLVQKHTHQWNPMQSAMEWQVDDVLQKVIKNKAGLSVFENGESINPISNPEALVEIMDAAYYVFWQPYKLLNPNNAMTYEGTTRLLGNQEVHVVKVQYENHAEADIWHYYFDTTDFRLRATQVKHLGRSSLIMNESQEEVTGLFLNKIRKSYILKPDGSIDYLRAAYDYSVLTYEAHH